jgi:hypothetical protein
MNPHDSQIHRSSVSVVMRAHIRLT